MLRSPKPQQSVFFKIVSQDLPDLLIL